MQCQPIRMKHRRLCAGDLDRKITIKSRTLSTPLGDVDFEQVFESTKSVWSAVVTVKGRVMFGATQMENPATHIFYVRWINVLTAESWVVYRGENSRIIDVENLDERNEWAALS